jgi:hypothetical protein
MSLEAALEYIQNGWSVFPIGAPTPGTGDKKGRHGEPLIKWAHLQERLPTEEEVRSWFKTWPDANLAIITGRVSGLVVVDIDPRKGGTTDRGLPSTGCVARTGGGGWHYFYAYPPGASRVHNQVNGDDAPDPIRRGRDVRGDGGYVIAPPSKHWSGGSYSWQSLEPLALGEPPGWSLSKPRDATDDNGRKERWLTKLIEGGTKPGQRNDDLTRFAGYLASVGIPQDVGLAIARVWIRDQDSPLHDGEVEVTVRSAYRTERRRNPERYRKQQKKARTPRKLFQTLTLNQFMRKYGDQEIKWSVEDWLPESTVGFIASPPGGFKTWLTFDLGVSIASGRPFLGKYPVREPGPVLIVQQEDFNAQTASRNALVIMKRMGLKAPKLELLDEGFLDVPLMPGDGELPLHFHADRELRFDDPELMDALEDAVREIRPKLVICDPFYQLVTTDEYMAKAAADMSRLKTLRDQYRTSFMMVHHTTKGGENEFGRSKLWGSQFLNAFAESLWHIRRPEDEEFNIVKRSFKLTGVQTPVRIDFKIDDAAYQYEANPENITKEEADRLIKAPNQERGTKGGGGYTSVGKDIVAALSVAGDGLSTQELSDQTGHPPNKVESTARKLAQKGDISQDAARRWRTAVPEY